MRGLPGSGKSYTVNQLVEKDNIFSTDDFWGEDYNFDIKKIGIAHGWNQKRAKKAMESGISPIAVDNTNTCWKEIKNYVAFAEEFGYDVIYKEPESEWWNRMLPIIESDNQFQKEVEACFLESRNQHNVPKVAILRMMERWTPTKYLPKSTVSSTK